MTITYRDQISRDLTPAEVDANFRHVLDSTNSTFAQSGIGTRTRTVAEKLQDTLNLNDFTGVDDTGATDSEDGINAAFAAAVAAGQTVVSDGGTFLCNDQLLLRSGLKWRFSDNVFFKRNFSGGAFVTHTTFATPLTGLQLMGGKFGGVDHTYTGGTFLVHSDDGVFSDILVDYYKTGLAYLMAGDRNLYIGVRATNPHAAVGSGGFRYFAGDDSRAVGLSIDAGDDALQVVPAGASSLFLPDASVTRFTYTGCYGRSRAARVISVGLVDADASPSTAITMTASIKDVHYKNITGWGGDRCGIIYNDNSSGVVQNITVNGASLTMTGQTTSASQEFVVSQNNSSGGVKTVRLTDVSVRDNAKIAFGTTGAVSDIKTKGCHWGAPSTTATQTVSLTSAVDVVMDGDTVECGTGVEAVHVGTGGGCTNVRLLNLTINEIENGQYGVFIVNCTGFEIAGGDYNKESGQNTARGINVAANGTLGHIHNVDVSNLHTTPANRVVNNSTSILIENNIGFVTNGSGTGAIASGATTATVTHSLNRTPTLAEIDVIFGEQGTNDYGRTWVDTIGATTFVVNVSADPGASNLDFAWRVRPVSR